MGVPVLIGVCQQASGGGGGGGSPPPATNEVIVATTTGTGNYANAVKIGFWDFNTNTYAYSNGIKMAQLLYYQQAQALQEQYKRKILLLAIILPHSTKILRRFLS